MSLPVPGWYPDPLAADELRWWDGSGWTAIAQSPSRLPVVPAGYAERVRGYLVDAVGLWIFSFVVLSPFHQTLADELGGILASSLLTGNGMPGLQTLWDYGIIQVWLTAAIPGVLARVAYDVFCHVRRGATWGQSSSGLRILEGSAPGRAGGIGWQRALIRSVVLRAAAPTVVLWLVVVLWPLVDRQQRTLADVVAGTRVVRAEQPQWWQGS